MLPAGVNFQPLGNSTGELPACNANAAQPSAAPNARARNEMVCKMGRIKSSCREGPAQVPRFRAAMHQCGGVDSPRGAPLMPGVQTHRHHYTVLVSLTES